MKESAKLRFEGVHLGSTPGQGMHLVLHGGDLVHILGNAARFFDIIEGLDRPTSGLVTFLDRTWTSLSPFDECRQRGMIGRSFDSAKAWVKNLTLRQNIELSAMHHRQMPEPEIQAETHRMAEELDVIHALDLRPEGIQPSILARCQWIRAFSGRPELLLFDAPLQDVSKDKHDIIFTWTKDNLAAGGTVFWAAKDPPDSALAPHNYYVLNISEDEIAIERRLT